MSDLPPNPEIKPQAPKKSFRYFCQKVLPAVYDDSLSYYELLCKLTDKVNEIITGDQSQVGAIEELQSLYEDLRSYIENLDLTDEVELALDKMAQSGELERIMALYLRAMNVYGFKDKSKMKQSQVIGDGSICKLLGQTNYQTGDGAYYLIRERTSGDIIDDDNIILLTAKPSCVAEKIPDYYINDLSTTVGTLSDNLDALSTLHTNEIGDLNNLTTTVKTNLVGAINDVNGKTIEVSQGGTGATSASDARTNIDVYSKTETNNAINTALQGLGTIFRFKGSVATVNDLPASNNEIGDVYYVVAKSVGYIWLDDNGTERWEEIGEPINTTDFLTKSGLLSTTGTATNNTMHQSAITTELNLKANSADLATVATTGLYTDLTSTPTQLTDFSGTLPINQGGTGATTALGALINLGVSDTNQMNFTANDYASWLSQVQTYVDNNLQTRRTFVFNAGWEGEGYGCGLAYQTLDTGFKFLILFNTVDEAGVKHYYKEPNGNWTHADVNDGIILYDNGIGTNSNITLYDSASNYNRLKICYFNDDSNYFDLEISEPNGKTTLLSSQRYVHSTGNTYFKTCEITISGTTLAFATENYNMLKITSGGVMTYHHNQTFKIYKVIGYKK